MASMRRNSPEAVARVLGALLTRGGRLDPQGVDFMDRLGVFSILGVQRGLFMKVASELLREPRRIEGMSLEPRVERNARLDAALDAVVNRDQRHLVCAVLLYLAEADQRIDDDEIALVRHIFGRWGVSAETLERELNVPRRHVQPFVDAGRLDGV